MKEPFSYTDIFLGHLLYANEKEISLKLMSNEFGTVIKRETFLQAVTELTPPINWKVFTQIFNLF